VNTLDRVLLDTNVLIHREARTVVRDDIGALFQWLDKLRMTKLVHPGSMDEIARHGDPEVVRSLGIKLGSYSVLRTLAPDTPEITALRGADLDANDSLDTSLLAELVAGRVDAVITEDRGIHRKAAALGVAATVFTIDSFLEKVTAENPTQADYKVLSVRRSFFGEVRLGDAFFDSFRADYPGFDAWFNRKADEPAYVCTGDDGSILAFLYLKREAAGENYSDIAPAFTSANRLKIGTLKVVSNGFKIGERFLKIVFDNALRYRVDEIYVTVFRRRAEHEALVRFLEDWGFARHGTKTSLAGTEDVFVRDFRPRIDATDPRRSFPYLAANARKFIVAIKPEYHTELLPDSILRTESPEAYSANKPNRNALSKVFVSRSFERGLRKGDIIVFYRTAPPGKAAYYHSVVTTLGVVQEVFLDITTFEEFVRICRRRTVFSEEGLKRQWTGGSSRPFVVNFLYVYTFRTRPNRKTLLEAGAMTDAPRGFDLLSEAAFGTIMKLANADTNLIIG
jgi:hypothetical protein